MRTIFIEIQKIPAQITNNGLSWPENGSIEAGSGMYK